MPTPRSRRSRANTRHLPVIADDHPQAPILDWLLVLLNAVRSSDCSELPLSPIEIHLQLAPLRPTPTIPDPQLIADAHPFSPLDWRNALDTVLRALDLLKIDPGFAWERGGTISAVTQLEHCSFPWRLREQLRLISGHYKPAPWKDVLNPIANHFAHISVDQPHLIAYTQDDKKGDADIQTPIKPGRYLARFYPELSPERLRDIQACLPKPATLRFAASPDEIEAVYCNGPSSCMSHRASNYSSDRHPVRVYGDSDLQLAYIANASGHATARALVRPEHKTYGRIYGDEALLKSLLDDQGYRRGELAGARIRRIDQDDDMVVMPYIDDCQSFGIVDAEWLKIGGDYPAGSTNGLASLSLEACENCGDHHHPDDLFYVNGDHWCESCDNSHAFTSEYSDERYPDSLQAEVIIRRRGDTNVIAIWADHERDEHAVHCEGSDLYYAEDHFEFVTLKSGEVWEKQTFERDGNPADLIPDDDPPAPDAHPTEPTASTTAPSSSAAVDRAAA